MQLIYLIIILFIFSFLFIFGSKKTTDYRTSPILKEIMASPQETPIPVLITASLTKEEVEKKLKILAKSTAPSNLSQGAMCYKVAGPPDRVEYVCPVCGEKTIYASKSEDNYDGLYYQTAEIINKDIPECRRLEKEIREISIKVDEKQFCKKCSPKILNPELILIVKYKGQSEPNVVKGVSGNDLKLLWEFFNGQNKHSDNYDNETPLKNYLERLEELLGVSVSK